MLNNLAADLHILIETLFLGGACLSGGVGFFLRRFDRRSRLEIAAGAPDASMPWLGAALGFLLLRFLLPLMSPAGR